MFFELVDYAIRFNFKASYSNFLMLITTALSLFFLFWSVLFLLDFCLRTTQNEKYLTFIERCGFSVMPFQIRFYVNHVDHDGGYVPLSFMYDAWSSPTTRQRVLRVLLGWFSAGTLVGLACFAVTPIYLTWLLAIELSNVARFLRWRIESSEFGVSGGGLHPLAAAFLPTPSATLAPLEQENVNFKMAMSDFNADHSLFYIPLQEHVQTGITPVIPGVNIPWSHLPLFMFVLVLAGVFHELGHAIAALNANVRLNGFGIFLFGVYPGAFTELETGELSRSTSAQKLRIFTAGIWHNIILALVGMLIVWFAPIFFVPFYESGKGVVITDVSEKSGLYGPNGFQPGHIVTQINQCRVSKSTEWTQCLKQMHNRQIAGAAAAAAQGPFTSATVTAAATGGYLVQYAKVRPLTALQANVRDVAESGEVQCCAEFGNVTPSHICFRYYPTLDQLFKSPKDVSKNSYASETIRTNIDDDKILQDPKQRGPAGRANRVPHHDYEVANLSNLNYKTKKNEAVSENTYLNSLIDLDMKENKEKKVTHRNLLKFPIDSVNNAPNLKRQPTSAAPKFADSLGLNRQKRSHTIDQVLAEVQQISKENNKPKQLPVNNQDLFVQSPSSSNLPLKTSTNTKNAFQNVKRPKHELLEKVVRHACLPARQITEHAACEQIDEKLNVRKTPTGYVCVTPALFNGTALLRFEMKNRSRPVLFVGFLSEPLYMIDLMDITPRFDWIPYWIPLVVELFGKYLLTFSLAMALLNAVPCHGLDGQYMCETIVDYFHSHNSTEQRHKISSRIVAFGTTVFALNVSIGLIKFLFNYWK